MRLVATQRSEPSLDPAGVPSNRLAIIYLVNQYPAVTHTFIKREVLALERLGIDVIRVAARTGRVQLYRWCDGEDQRKIKLIRCGLEQQFHEAAEDAPCEVARFLCVGQLYRLKGQDVLVKAAAVMAAAGHKFEVVLVGDGEGRAELESLIASLKLSATVRLVGWLSSADVRRQMTGARALVVPSFAENLSVVIMEAMALRRPVVATPRSRSPGRPASKERVAAASCDRNRATSHSRGAIEC
jgi:glycosyltransferase involved in cell wall biosynthesis